jgi:RNA polymerase sigma-70 factor (ECF subfamily)
MSIPTGPSPGGAVPVAVPVVAPVPVPGIERPAGRRVDTVVVGDAAGDAVVARAGADVGDRAGAPGYEHLYRREYAALVAVAVALTGDRDGAPDLVHDTMVKALVRWDRVSGLDRPGAWCQHVLVNACRSQLRRRTTQWRYLARQRRTEPSTPEPSTDTLAFWEAVRSLPSRPRAVVALHFAADLTSVQIAAVLGVPEGTVRTDLTAARRTVMAAMREDLDD